jgi:arsenite methyltransferase
LPDLRTTSPNNRRVGRIIRDVPHTADASADAPRLILEVPAYEKGNDPHPHNSAELESLYERFPWLYAFCRDHLFRDDTEKIALALWPAGIPREGANVVEFGCGPGFYARRLAGYSGRLRVTGIDRSARQLHRARAASSKVENCRFEVGDVLDLHLPAASADAIISSRLFLIISGSEREQVISEMHRVLRPGGRCFIAEPRSALRAAVPLAAMRLIARLTNLRAKLNRSGKARRYREPENISVLDEKGFEALVGSQPWKETRLWQDIWYQYAVCEKDQE